MSITFLKRTGIKLTSIFFLMILTLQVKAINQDTRPAELEYADKKLNAIYKKILGRLMPNEQLKLKKAQREWIIFRDLDCKWAFTAEPLDCLANRTDNRVKELQDTVFSDSKDNYSSIDE